MVCFRLYVCSLYLKILEYCCR